MIRENLFGTVKEVAAFRTWYNWRTYRAILSIAVRVVDTVLATLQTPFRKIRHWLCPFRPSPVLCGRHRIVPAASRCPAMLAPKPRAKRKARKDFPPCGPPLSVSPLALLLSAYAGLHQALPEAAMWRFLCQTFSIPLLPRCIFSIAIAIPSRRIVALEYSCSSSQRRASIVASARHLLILAWLFPQSAISFSMN